jgi:Uma2 family endonuclease
MPKWLHSRLQHLLSVRLHNAGLLCAPELHLRLTADTARIADIAVYLNPPDGAMASCPPFIAIEVVSPDDRHQELLRKLQDYLAWGVVHIWVVEPELSKFHIYDSRGLVERDCFELPEYGFRVSAAELFAEATAR